MGDVYHVMHGMDTSDGAAGLPRPRAGSQRVPDRRSHREAGAPLWWFWGPSGPSVASTAMERILQPSAPEPVSPSTRRVAQGLAFFALTCVVGVVGYVVAGWTPMDALYMVIITIFGVGYGEVRPVVGSELRGFTILIIVGGYAAAIYAVGGFVQWLTEGEINRALGVRRMNREIQGLRGHSIVCGYGRIGRILARHLAGHRVPFVVVERSPAKVVEAESEGFLVVSGDATDEEVLRRAGAEHATVLATVLPDDAANVFIALTASGINRGLEIVARAEDPRSESKLRRSGATRVVLPAAIGAERIAHLITRPGAEELLREEGAAAALATELEQIGLRFEELRIGSRSPLVGRALSDIEIRGNRGFLIVGVRSPDGQVAVNPPGDRALGEGDTVIVVGHPDDLPQLRQRYELDRELIYRGARVRR